EHKTGKDGRLSVPTDGVHQRGAGSFAHIGRKKIRRNRYYHFRYRLLSLHAGFDKRDVLKDVGWLAGGDGELDLRLVDGERDHYQIDLNVIMAVVVLFDDFLEDLFVSPPHGAGHPECDALCAFLL